MVDHKAEAIEQAGCYGDKTTDSPDDTLRFGGKSSIPRKEMKPTENKSREYATEVHLQEERETLGFFCRALCCSIIWPSASSASIVGL